MKGAPPIRRRYWRFEAWQREQRAVASEDAFLDRVRNLLSTIPAAAWPLGYRVGIQRGRLILAYMYPQERA